MNSSIISSCTALTASDSSSYITISIVPSSFEKSQAEKVSIENDNRQKNQYFSYGFHISLLLVILNKFFVNYCYFYLGMPIYYNQLLNYFPT